MEVKNKDLNSSGNSGIRVIFTTITCLISILALVATGFTLWQISQLQQQISELKNSVNSLSAANQNQAPSPTGQNGSPFAAPPMASASPPAATPPQLTQSPTAPTNNAYQAPGNTTTAPTSSGSVSLQPGQFVRPTHRNKGQVELLKVNRIPGERDVVNVQVRVRILRPEKTTYGSDNINMAGTTARNPQTSETYAAISGESTDSVSLFSMNLNNQTSVDAYVWLRVPEGVNSLEIYIPDTETFANVPISSQ